MTKKYLIGATKENDIVFAEFGITTRNGYNEFTASFETVRPFIGTNYDLAEYFEDMIDSCFDDAEKYRLCEQYNCRPSKLAKSMANKCEDVRDALDCSLFPEHYVIDGDDWYFESGSCGQHDTRDEMDEIINIDAYNALHDLWDNYHLKAVDDVTVCNVEALQDRMIECDGLKEVDWIVDYIRRHVDEY